MPCLWHAAAKARMLVHFLRHIRQKFGAKILRQILGEAAAALRRSVDNQGKVRYDELMTSGDLWQPL